MDKKQIIEELHKKHNETDQLYDCTAYDEGQVCCIEKEWFEQWLSQKLDEVEEKAYDKFFQAIDAKFKSYKIDKEMGEILHELKNNK